MSLFVSSLPSHWTPARTKATRSRLIAKQKPSLSIIVTTCNNAGDIKRLTRQLGRVAALMPLEIIFVDDSTDETPDIIRSLRQSATYHINLLPRLPGQRQVGSCDAIMRGFQAARAPWICVMNANLQHPPELIPQLVARAEQTGSDLVMGNRLSQENNASRFDTISTMIYEWLMSMARMIFPERLGGVNDPTTDFFLLRKNAIDLNQIHLYSFPILLTILFHFPELKSTEVPFEMGRRFVKESQNYTHANILQKGIKESYA